MGHFQSSETVFDEKYSLNDPKNITLEEKHSLLAFIILFIFKKLNLVKCALILFALQYNNLQDINNCLEHVHCHAKRYYRPVGKFDIMLWPVVVNLTRMFQILVWQALVNLSNLVWLWQGPHLPPYFLCITF